MLVRQRAQHNPLALHRFAALNTFRSMCAELALGGTLSAARTADIICTLCDAALEGPDRISSELLDPATTWQSQMMLGRVGVRDNRDDEVVMSSFMQADSRNRYPRKWQVDTANGGSACVRRTVCMLHMPYSVATLHLRPNSCSTLSSTDRT